MRIDERGRVTSKIKYQTSLCGVVLDAVKDFTASADHGHR